MVKRFFGLLVTVSAFLLATGFHPKPAQSWIEFNSKEGGFSILMPHKPARQNSPTSTDVGTVDIVIFTATTDGAFYGVIYSDFPSVPSNDVEINKRLDKGRDGGIAQAKGKLVSETRITLDGFLGREIKAKLDEGYLLARVYSVKQRVYQIIMAGNEADLASENAKRFFNSFKLVKETPPADQPDWVEFSSAEGGFTVSMPGRPDKESVPVNTPGEKTSMYFFSHATPEGLAYVASYADMKLDLGTASKVTMFLDGVRQGQLQTNKASKLISEQAITFEGHPGREFLIETPTGISMSRVYLIGNRVYQLFFVKPSGYQDTEKRGQRFLDSFKLTKR